MGHTIFWFHDSEITSFLPQKMSREMLFFVKVSSFQRRAFAQNDKVLLMYFSGSCIPIDPNSEAFLLLVLPTVH
jgi:hypothetical protein